MVYRLGIRFYKIFKCLRYDGFWCDFRDELVGKVWSLSQLLGKEVMFDPDEEVRLVV